MLSRILLLTMIAAVLTACGNREREPVYVQSEEIDPIEVPPGLTRPDVRQTFEVPGYSLPELAARGSEPRPPNVQPSAEAERSRSQIRFGATGLFLEVQDEPDSVWRRLGFTLNRDGMRVQQIDEPERRYRFRFTHDPIEVDRTGLSRLAFWRSGEITDYSGDYRIEVRDGTGNTTRVVLLDTEGQVIDMDRAEYVLARLRDRLG